MNFLAHLHLAKLADSSLLGNLLADFVRGNPDELYPPHIVSGIRMHRRVDSMTDSLPEVKQAQRLFRPEYRRVSAITLDVVWDHFLSLNWDQIEPHIALKDFLQLSANDITPHLPDMPERFRNMNRYLWSERWMERYAELPFIGRVLNGMAQRRPRLAALADSFADVENNYDALEALFWQFYPNMMHQAKIHEI
ncbi:ACP phosphodiesterase [Rouxiella sp. Mn2063]|uniref:ACP phosphodiesterase n=1 Tax=Rouxiella sp. Mn2063 TaxID=3395262 RepID=UPI003BCC578B